MRQINISRLFILLLLSIGAFAAVSTVNAQQPNTNDRTNPLFCNGTIGWTFDGQVLDEDVAPCGGSPDTLIVQVTKLWSPGNFGTLVQNMTWRAAVQYKNAQGYVNGSLWVPKQSKPIVSQPASGNGMPNGFCQGGIPWQVAKDLVVNDPNCGSGVYIWTSDTANGQQRYNTWSEASTTRGNSAVTFWFEPAAAPQGQMNQGQAQPTAPIVTSGQTQINWGPICENVEALAFSNQNAVQNINTLAGLNPPCGSGVWWINAPWRPGCEGADAFAFLRNSNCNYPTQFGFNQWSSAIAWLQSNGWTEGSFWFEANSKVTSTEPAQRCNKEAPGVKVCDRPFQLLSGTTEGGFSLPAMQPTSVPSTPTSIAPPAPPTTQYVPPTLLPTATNQPSMPTPTSVATQPTPVPSGNNNNPQPTNTGGGFDWVPWALGIGGCLFVLLLLAIGGGILLSRRNGANTNSRTSSTTNTTSTTSTTPPLAIGATSPLPQATVGTRYDADLNIAGGVPPIKVYFIGNPAWLLFDQVTGHLIGLPTAAGDHKVKVVVIDDAANKVEKEFKLKVVV